MPPVTPKVTKVNQPSPTKTPVMSQSLYPLKKGDIDPIVGKPVEYPNVIVELRTNGSEKGPLTEKEAEEILGWEDEDMYAKRIMAADPSVKEDQCKFGDNFLFQLPDTKKKVQCSYNLTNRPLTIEWSKSLSQDFLFKEWAGTSDVPGTTINGETIVIGRCGGVLSGQHRLIGFKLACMYWRGKEADKWKKIWPTAPTFPCIIVYGVDESPRTVRTLDNVRPRSLSDVIYTSDAFRDLTKDGRQECARMLDVATDMLWKRTRMGIGEGATKYQTHGSSMDFISKHMKLQDCIRHIYNNNAPKTGEKASAGRTYSARKLSAGECACLMYLMGSSKTVADDYYCEESGNNIIEKSSCDRTESDLDFRLYDKAKLFWTLLADKNDPTLQDVWKTKRPSVGDFPTNYSGYIFPQTPGGECASSREEKLAVLCMAWESFSEGVEVKADDLKLAYNLSDVGDDGRLLTFTLVGEYGVEGIDQGEIPKKIDEDKPKKEKKAKTPKDDGAGKRVKISSITPPTVDQVKTTLPSRPPMNETPEQERKRRSEVLSQVASGRKSSNDAKFEEIKSSTNEDNFDMPDDEPTERVEEEVPLEPEEEQELEEPEEEAPPPPVKHKPIVRKP